MNVESGGWDMRAHEDILKTVQIEFTDSIFDGGERRTPNEATDGADADGDANGNTGEYGHWSAVMGPTRTATSVSFGGIRRLFRSLFTGRRTADNDVACQGKNSLSTVTRNKETTVSLDGMLRAVFAHEGRADLLLLAYKELLSLDSAAFTMRVLDEYRRVIKIEKECFGVAMAHQTLVVFVNHWAALFPRELTGENVAAELLEGDTKAFISATDSLAAATFIASSRGGLNAMAHAQTLQHSINAFRPEDMARVVATMEAELFATLDLRELYRYAPDGGDKCVPDIASFVTFFNRITNLIISEILLGESEKERLQTVKRVLQLAREFHQLGAMNGLKAAMGALQAASIHRLNLISRLGSKHRRCYAELEAFASPSDNFRAMRRHNSLAPWLGIVLRDFVFLRETVRMLDGADGKGGRVHIPIAACLARIVESLAVSQRACGCFVRDNKEDCDAVLLRAWICDREIVYEDACAQYNRSQAIL